MFQVVLKDLREDEKLSQRELAVKLGVAQSTIGMWESGKREPDYKTLNKLAEFFNVPSSLLLGSYPFQKWDLIKKNKNTILQEINHRFPELLKEIGVSLDGEPLNKFVRLLEMTISDVEESEDRSVTLVFTSEWAIEMLTGKQKNKPVSEEDRLRSETQNLFDKLPKEKQQQAVEYLRFLVEHQDKE